MIKKELTQCDFAPKGEESLKTMWIRQHLSLRPGQQIELSSVRADIILQKARLFDTPSAFFRLYEGRYLSLAISSSNIIYEGIELSPYNFTQVADSKKMDLHESMTRFHNKRSDDFYNKLQNCYESAKSALHVVKSQDDLKIPQTIHSLWVNKTGEEWHKEYAQLLMDTMKACPTSLGWTHILWVSKKDQWIAKIPLLGLDPNLESLIEVKEIDNLPLPLQSRGHPIWDHNKLIEQGLYSAASQVLRYEILAQLGGIYRSTDCQITKSLIPFNQALNFYTGMDSNFMQYSRDFLIGSSVNHPIVLEYLEQLLNSTNQDSSPADYLKGHIRLSYAFDAKAGENGNQDVIMPHQVFSPLKGDAQVRSAFDTNMMLHEGSFAIHLFDRSWVQQNSNKEFKESLSTYSAITNNNKLAEHIEQYGFPSSQSAFLYKKGLFYLRIYKNCCSTLNNLFLYLSNGFVARDEPGTVWDKNVSSLFIEQFVGMNFINFVLQNNLLSFTFVRNPYSRALSSFLNRNNESSTFSDFLKNLSTQGIKDMGGHVKPQFALTMQPVLPIKFIGRFESFNEDFGKLLKMLNVDKPVDYFNITHHATGANSKLSQYYTKECVELVQQIYQKDFEIFGYSMEPNFEVKKAPNFEVKES